MEIFSQRIKNIISYSKEEAERLGNISVQVEHLYLGILREGGGLAYDYLKDLGVDIPHTKELIDENMRITVASRIDKSIIPFDSVAQRVIKFLYLEARILKDNVIDTEHLLLAILKDDTSFITKILNKYDVKYHALRRKVEELQRKNEFKSTHSYMGEGKESSMKKHTEISEKSKTPILDNFCTDITHLAKKEDLDPIVGRKNEIERLVQILSRRKKNNPILLGEPGVGKSAIAEGLALRIIEQKVSSNLHDKRLLSLDLASIVAGTKYRGQFEERIKSIIDELKKNEDIILFIDEIHTLVGAGGSTGSLDAANILKPALARGEIQCIGATTLNEYRQHIEKDGALDRRFQRIIVDPTSEEETLIILNSIKERYEEHHNINYTPEALEACVKLTSRYISDRNLPDKAIDAMDEAGARVHVTNLILSPAVEALKNKLRKITSRKKDAVGQQDFELAAKFRDLERKIERELKIAKEEWKLEMKSNRQQVTYDHISEVIAMMTGVTTKRIAQSESKRLQNMEKELQAKVIGQNDAIEKITRAIKRNRTGMKDPNRNIGSFIFLGPTGVGKTQLAKVLSEYLFDSKEALIRIDMSEYVEKFSISRLVGAPPGYIGYEEGGQLTERVRRKPYSVVLLDEIEKAHPNIFSLLLQILDDGHITDSLGRKIDFKNTIIIMTSNIGSRELSDFGRGIGFETALKESDDEYAKSVIGKALKREFAPEFLNRIDDIILFDTLQHQDIRQIIDIELQGIFERLKDIGYNFKITEKAKDFVAEKGFDKEFGARPLKRAIQQYIEEELSELIIKGNLTSGDTIVAKSKKGASRLIIEKKKT